LLRWAEPGSAIVRYRYFNLHGDGSGPVLNQELTLFADEYTPPSPITGVPDGTISRVVGTPFDFRKPHPIGLFIDRPGVGDLPTIGKDGREYRIHEALALETQKYPNAINYPPSVKPGREDELVRPNRGETYSHTMVMKFSAE
jgi:hypothetical protein